MVYQTLATRDATAQEIWACAVKSPIELICVDDSGKQYGSGYVHMDLELAGL